MKQNNYQKVGNSKPANLCHFDVSMWQQYELNLQRRVDDHIKEKLSAGIKTAINLIVESFDLNLQSKLIGLVK